MESGRCCEGEDEGESSAPDARHGIRFVVLDGIGQVALGPDVDFGGERQELGFGEDSRGVAYAGVLMRQPVGPQGRPGGGIGREGIVYCTWSVGHSKSTDGAPSLAMQT